MLISMQNLRQKLILMQNLRQMLMSMLNYRQILMQNSRQMLISMQNISRVYGRFRRIASSFQSFIFFLRWRIKFTKTIQLPNTTNFLLNFTNIILSLDAIFYGKSFSNTTFCMKLVALLLIFHLSKRSIQFHLKFLSAAYMVCLIRK